MEKRFKIGTRGVGDGEPVFIIAEAGSNHNGSFELAGKLIDMAADAGADAVKFQTFNAEKLSTRRTPKAVYQKKTTGTDESHLEMLKKLQLSTADFVELKTRAKRRGILFFSTPFDLGSVDTLADIGVPCFKIGSGDMDNLPLVRRAAAKGLPMLMSTGMSTLAEVEQAVNAIAAQGNRRVLLFHCVSAYPPNPADVNLRVMKTLADAFDVPVGYSDHCISDTLSTAAVALGAAAIEKHITLDRNMMGPDHHMSADPEDFARLVKRIRKVESAMGSGIKRVLDCEVDIRVTHRKSVVAAKKIKKGQKLTPAALDVRRPQGGIEPLKWDLVVGRRARRDIEPEEAITWDMIE